MVLSIYIFIAIISIFAIAYPFHYYDIETQDIKFVKNCIENNGLVFDTHLTRPICKIPTDSVTVQTTKQQNSQ